MTEFSSESLAAARFDDVDLSDARFEDVSFARAWIRNADLRDVVIRGALVGMDLDGDIQSLRVNGVDVVPFVEAELDRRYPDRVLMRPEDAAGFRAAWEVLGPLWEGTVARARRLPPEMLHERVDDEWSFIETLRHLLFATDAWVRRAVLGEPTPWDPLDLPHEEMPDLLSVPWDRAARPSLDTVLALRADRMATVREVFAGLTDESLAGMTEPVTEPGYPAPESYPVRRCLRALVNEEWEHRLIAERDLAVLESRTAL